ncbi:16S rRNA (guanine(527)-N(7))-methyltransferase RsmG [Cyanobium sp. NS01]|jgi:16S rRNA (guanine527-N7)-methyltransferase|uniref:16S rRNA (guanine(527)-N(7))-methyltransferase RsmG n=1 Tax=Cyanobium sp. NS01 TaxID=261284 RepID=UPI0016476879|nr:RsmG family class I SAM-dependent methyltransferase [Cyanobium sp. NS01]QNI69768.1 16S rRNA (guanine(527)-N(7))-methyltransferase GidB [Cyanobium sp. NS01]
MPTAPGLQAAGSLQPEALWSRLGWRPDPDQLRGFEHLQDELRLWNGRRNLTRLVEGDDYWISQVFDSLWPLRALLQSPHAAEPLEMIDVGTGCGFPGLAIALALPRARLTLVDSVGRKLEAVTAMAAALGLDSRVSVRLERVELSGRAVECRGRFALAMARAVAAAPVVAEYLVPLLAPGGQALLYRGQWSGTDQEPLERAARALKAEVSAVTSCDLPAGRGIRHAVWLSPAAPCPQAYPRAVGVPSRHPLGSS